MKIKIAHEPNLGIYTISKRVKSWLSIRDTALKFQQWLNESQGNFDGDKRIAFAVSHCQVEDEPYHMFVVNKDFINMLKISDTKGRNKKNFYFKHQIIINAEVLEAPEKIQHEVPERKFKENGEPIISIKDKILSNKIYVPDGCMSFPKKKQKNVEIFYKVKVRYQIPSWRGLKTVTEWVEGVKAHIFQHEIDHSRGINIYYGAKQPTTRG